MHLLRCVLVALAATTLTAVALQLLVPSIVTGSPDFEGCLVRGCAAVAAVCVIWGWLSAVAVVIEVLRGPRAAPARVPAVVRRLLLAACGVALTATGPALAASGDAPRALPEIAAGLPFPARATDAGLTRAVTGRIVVVAPGDSLWDIATRYLPAGASDAEITRAWQHIHHRNRAVIGDDPALIRPGQRLELPGHLGL